MKKAKMHTPNLTQENIARIRELFPNCVTEIKDPDAKPDAEVTVKYAIDFDLLKQELSGQIVEGPVERYQLNWPGKREALLAANAPIAKTLRPVREESVNFDTTENLFIEGDNLDALKLLQEAYLGKVKMIYIDPPYNTGNDFIYNDDFAENSDEYLVRSNQKDEEGNRLVANSESNGRFHSDWLSMMYPRLKLARNLLSDDGVIFISIDDGEVHNLRKMCEEIFGDGNFVSNIVWEKKYAPANDAKWLSNTHDNVLVFAKEKEEWRPQLLPRSEEQNSRYSNRDGDPRGAWKSSDLSVKSYSALYDYSITTPSGRVVTPPHGACWRVSREKLAELIADDRIWFGENGDNVPSIKRFLTEVRSGVVPITVWKHTDVGHNQIGHQELKKLFDDRGFFEGPKPVSLLRRIIFIANTADDDIILDFFAGSATTAHAVMQLNAEDDGNRKFILVQLPEECDPKSEAYKAGYETIADIAKERIRRAGKKIQEELSAKAAPAQKKKMKENTAGLFDAGVAENGTDPEAAGKAPGSRELDIGFRVLKVDSSCMADVYYTPDQTNQQDLTGLVENIKSDRTEEDLLFQVLLDWGVDLTLPIVREKIEKLDVFFVDRDSLAACFAKDGKITERLVEQIAERSPMRVVFRDAGFKSDSVRINVEQIFKQKSPRTEIRTI